MGFVGRGPSNRLIRVAASSSLAALLLIAGPGGALAQSAAQDQYDVTQEQYSGGGVQQAPVGPGDPAYPGLTTPSPPSAPPDGALGEGGASAQEQYSGGAAGPAPSPVPPAGPSQAPPEPAPEGPSSPGPASSGSEGAGPSQVPVGPDDPAHPGLASQPPQTFGQDLAEVSAELGGIGQSLAAVNQGAAPTTAASDPYPAAAVAAFSAPTTAVVGGTSPGQPPVAAVDPYSAATNAVSAVGGGAPGYTTTSGQVPPGVAVLGGPPQGQQADVAVVDPFSAAVGAASPSVPGQTAQVAQYLQRLLLLRDLMGAEQALQQGAGEALREEQGWLAYQQGGLAQTVQTLARAVPPAGQVGLAAGIAPASGNTEALMMTHELGCNMSGLWGAGPDSLNDADFAGNDPSLGVMATGDVADSCDHLSGGTPTTLPFETP